MADLLRYHQTLAETTASYLSRARTARKHAPLPSEADGLAISHEYKPAASFAECFPRFLELPIDIRLKIWKHCLPGPRAVEVDCGERSEFLYSKYPRPIALHICRETR